MVRGLAVVVVALLASLVAAPAQAASGTFTCANLQAGLNQVQNGDTITVDGMCNDGYTLPSFADPGPAESFKSWTLQGSGGDDGFDGTGLIGERVLTGTDVHRLVIQNLTFRDSTLLGPGADGGAIDVTGQSGLQLFNNAFFNNEASDHGGAVHLAQDTPPDGFNNLGFSALGNVFGSTTNASEGNNALIGGAVSVESPGVNDQFSLTDNTFANNVAQWNGGGFAYELSGGGANVSLNGNHVLDNTAGGAGGGGHVSGPVGLAQVDNEHYQGNSVEPLAGSPQGDHLGGGLFLRAGVPNLRHNTFTSNSISSFPDGDLGGGGLAVVAPGVFGSSEFTRIVNNTVAGQPDGDFESEGGGIFISGVGFWTSFLDSIAGNSVGPLGEGGGVYTGTVISGTTLKLVESTVAGNTVGAGGHFAGISGDANDHLVARNSIVWNGAPGDIGGFADFDLKYSDACKNSGGAFDGEGNICTNPLLVNPSPGNADVHQTTASPTIDAGSDDLLSEAGGERPNTDYEDDPRPTDGDGDGHTVDMGADESPAFVAGPPPPPPHTPQCSDGTDNDGDGAIDGADPGCLAGPADDNEGDETPGDLVLCGQRTISLVRADVKGSKVELSGFVATSLAGQKVKLSVRYLGKGRKPTQLGSVTAGADGAFRGRVAKPSRKLFNVARYRAQVGSAKSVELKLPQSLASSSLKRAAGGTLELRGQVDRAVLGKRNAVVVKRILCGHYATVGQAKPDKKGRYAVRFPAPASGGSALYRAETKVLARPGSKRYVKQFARAIGITF